MRVKVFFSVLTLLGSAVVVQAGEKAPVTDDTLRDKVMMKLGTDQIVKGGGLGIDVKAGVVTLSGKVESEKQKQRAEKLSMKIAGVKSVENKIVVAAR